MLNVVARDTADIVGCSNSSLTATVGWKRVAVGVGGSSLTPTSAGVSPIGVGLNTKPVSGVAVTSGVVVTSGAVATGRGSVRVGGRVGAAVHVAGCVGRGGHVTSSFAISVSSTVGRAVSVARTGAAQLLWVGPSQWARPPPPAAADSAVRLGLT